jgi:hypothetical protein
MVKELFDISEITVSNILKEFSDSFGPDLTGLSLIKLDAPGEVMDRTGIFDNVVKRKKYLEKKNKTLENFENHFVTGQI